MNLLNKKQIETVYEIELTQGELDVLTAALGTTSEVIRAKMFEENKMSAPGVNRCAHPLYEFLKSLSSFKE